MKLHSYQSRGKGGTTNQCPDIRDHQQAGDPDSMSQRPSAIRPADSSPTDGRENPLLPPLRPRDELQQTTGRQGLGSGHERHQDNGGQNTTHLGQTREPQMTEQPFQGSPYDGEMRQSGSSRGLGVHNILNPTDPEAPGSSVSRPGGPLASSPQSGGPPFSQYPGASSSSSFIPQGYETPQMISPPQGQGQGGNSRGRKVLIPKSPRSISLGGRPAATINAQQSPFLPSRSHIYTADPGSEASSDVPPMPLLPGQSQQHFNLPHHATTDPRRTASVTMPAPLRTPLSQSASPSPSVRSTYSAPGQPSPATRLIQAQQQPQGGSYFPGSSLGSGPQQGEGFQTAHSGTEGPYMTPLPEGIFMGRQSGGQNPNIRMLPISTEHGQMFMPVDVTAASKVADEKRARNAGASARFRARRKEKEKEANNTIGNMQKDLKDKENELKEMETERNFYRAERDRFRDMVYRNPATRDMALQAPPSPRLTRTPAYPPPPSGSLYQPVSDQQSESGRPSQRRRVNPPGDFAFGGPPASNFPTPSFPPPPYPGQSYNPSPIPHPGGAVPPSSLPPLRMNNPAPPSGGGLPMPSASLPPTTRPSQFEQYPRSGYERGWPGGSGPEERKPSRQ